MTTGILEGAGLMGGVSITTLIISKLSVILNKMEKLDTAVALRMNLLSMMTKQKSKQLMLMILLYSMYLKNIMKIKNKI